MKLSQSLELFLPKRIRWFVEFDEFHKSAANEYNDQVPTGHTFHFWPGQASFAIIRQDLIDSSSTWSPNHRVHSNMKSNVLYKLVELPIFKATCTGCYQIANRFLRNTAAFIVLSLTYFDLLYFLIILARTMAKDASKREVSSEI